MDTSGGSVRTIIVGIRVSQSTTVTVELPQSAQAGAIVRVTRENSGSWTKDAVKGVWSTKLDTGDYVLAVDTEEKPSSLSPFSLRTDRVVQFMSARRNADTGAPGARELTSWTGTQLTVLDPKDPWPPPPPPPVTLAGTSFSDAIATSKVTSTLLTLIDAFSGKGADTPSEPRMHALLIGIDAYAPGVGQDGAIYRSLGGAVRDVLEVETFLRTRLLVPENQISVLLAPMPTGPGADRDVTLPTYENIVGAWQSLIERASPGDIVYIHYSGHGGRAKSTFPKKQTRFDECIAPCDINDRANGRYLRDVEIAALLRRMHQRDLITTLVLDSCYSGSATRGDQVQARRGDEDDTEPRGSDVLASLVAPAAELDAIAVELGQNAKGADEPWLLGGTAVPYTVIAACRAQESAYEYAFDGKTRRGALTYFWLEALAQRGAAMTYRTAYRTVFQNVQNLFRDQAPVLLGAADRQLLGTGIVAQPTSIAVGKVDGKMIELREGQTNLIGVGTTLAIIPGDMLPELVELSARPQVEVVDVDAATSRARIVANEAPIQPGSQAVITSYSPRLQRAVRLLLEEAGAAEDAALSAVRAEIEADPSKLLAISGQEGGDFQVAIDGGVFSILDPAGRRLENLGSAIEVAAPDAARRIKDRLVHLARFHNVLELRNTDRNSPLAGKLTAEILALPPTFQKGDPLDGATPILGMPQFQDLSWFCLRIQNRSARHLEIAILDLQPGWGITVLTEAHLDPGETRELAVRAFLPEGYTIGTDTLKVLGTLALANYELLTLPELGGQFARGAVARGDDANPLDLLFDSMLIPQTAKRHAEIGTAPTAGWASAEVSYTTSK